MDRKKCFGVEDNREYPIAPNNPIFYNRELYSGILNQSGRVECVERLMIVLNRPCILTYVNFQEGGWLGLKASDVIKRLLQESLASMISPLAIRPMHGGHSFYAHVTKVELLTKPGVDEGYLVRNEGTTKLVNSCANSTAVCSTWVPIWDKFGTTQFGALSLTLGPRRKQNEKEFPTPKHSTNAVTMAEKVKYGLAVIRNHKAPENDYQEYHRVMISVAEIEVKESEELNMSCDDIMYWAERALKDTTLGHVYIPNNLKATKGTWMLVELRSNSTHHMYKCFPNHLFFPFVVSDQSSWVAYYKDQYLGPLNENEPHDYHNGKTTVSWQGKSLDELATMLPGLRIEILDIEALVEKLESKDGYRVVLYETDRDRQEGRYDIGLLRSRVSKMNALFKHVAEKLDALDTWKQAELSDDSAGLYRIAVTHKYVLETLKERALLQPIGEQVITTCDLSISPDMWVMGESGLKILTEVPVALLHSGLNRVMLKTQGQDKIRGVLREKPRKNPGSVSVEVCLRAGTSENVLNKHLPEKTLDFVLSPDDQDDNNLRSEKLLVYHRRRLVSNGGQLKTPKDALLATITECNNASQTEIPKHIRLDSYNLNERQQKAAGCIVSDAPISNGARHILGPFGSGKSTMAVSTVLDAPEMIKKKVIMTATTNAAVDRMAELLTYTSGKFCLKLQTEARQLATGRQNSTYNVLWWLEQFVADFKAKHREPSHLTKLRRNHIELDDDDLMCYWKDISSKYDHTKPVDNQPVTQVDKIQVQVTLEAIKTADRIMKELTVIFIEAADVILGTIGMMLNVKDLRPLDRDGPINLQADTVIIDEASKLSDVDLIVAINLLKSKDSSALVLIGDSNQLGPSQYVTPSDQSLVMLNTLLYQRHTTGVLNRLVVHEQLSHYVALNEIYRHPFWMTSKNNHLWYDSSLVYRKPWPLPVYWSWPTADQLAIINMHGSESHRDGISKFGDTSVAADRAHSLYNPDEADKCAEIMLAMSYANTRFSPESIAILCVYKAQIACVREHLSACFPWQFIDKLTIMTVDSFQGQQRSLVFLLVSRSGKNNNFTAGFSDDPKRLNVASSRACDAMVILADVFGLSRVSTLWSDYFNSLGRYIM